MVGHLNVLKACAPAKSNNFLINLSFANGILTCSHASAINPLNCTGSDCRQLKIVHYFHFELRVLKVLSASYQFYYVRFVWTLPLRRGSGNKVRDKFSLTVSKNNLCCRRILWLQKIYRLCTFKKVVLIMITLIVTTLK